MSLVWDDLSPPANRMMSAHDCSDDRSGSFLFVQLPLVENSVGLAFDLPAGFVSILARRK